MFSKSDFNKLDLKRVGIYLLIVYSFAILTVIILALTGGLQNSPWALYLMPTSYMASPAIANILTRLITKEKWQQTWLRPNFKHGWKFWLLTWFVPGLLIMAGAALYFVFFPQSFDINMPYLQQLYQQSGETPSMPLWATALLQTVSGLFLAPFINGIFTFGEEFGWRGYLLQKLMPLGYRKALVILGIIWGTWHWPVIILGHNYGLDYPGAPYVGMLLFVWVCFCLGTFLSWAVLKAKSVWPAVIGHAAFNGMGAFAVLFLSGDLKPLLGPTAQGFIGIMGVAVLAMVLFIHPGEIPEYLAKTQEKTLDIPG